MSSVGSSLRSAWSGLPRSPRPRRRRRRPRSRRGRSIVDGAPLDHIGYEQRVHLYEYLPDGTVRPVAARYLASLLGQSGWLGREQGMAKDAGTSPRARVGWSSVASVYLDPCHWQTSTLGTADPPLMRNQDGLTEALNGWWPTATDSKVSADYKPAPFAPSRHGVAKSHRVERAPCRGARAHGPIRPRRRVMRWRRVSALGETGRPAEEPQPANISSSMSSTSNPVCSSSRRAGSRRRPRPRAARVRRVLWIGQKPGRAADDPEGDPDPVTVPQP